MKKKKSGLPPRNNIFLLLLIMPINHHKYTNEETSYQPRKKRLRRKLALKALTHLSPTQQVMGQAAQCAQVKKPMITSVPLLA